MTAYWQYVRCENQHLSWDTIRLYQQGEVDFLWFLPPDDLFFIIQVPWERALPFHVFTCNQNAGTVPNPEMKNNICNNWVSCLPANLKLHLKHFLKCRQCGLSIVLRWLSPVAGELFFFFSWQPLCGYTGLYVLTKQLPGTPHPRRVLTCIFTESVGR